MAEKQDLTRLLATNIATRRKGAGMTQAELAEVLGYSDKTVSKWERGEGLPDVLCLKRMADIFGTQMDDLFTDPDAPWMVESPSVDVENTTDVEETAEPVEPTAEANAVPEPVQENEKVNHKAVSAIAILGVWMLAALVFLIGYFCHKNLYLSWGIAVPVTGLLMVIFNGLWGARKYTFWTCSYFVVGLLFLICLLLHRYHVWMLMWLAVPAVVIVWLSCRVGKKK